MSDYKPSPFYDQRVHGERRYEFESQHESQVYHTQERVAALQKELEPLYQLASLLVDNPDPQMAQELRDGIYRLMR